MTPDDRFLAQGRRGLPGSRVPRADGVGTYANEIHIHHTVDRALQKEVGLIPSDDCPGFVTTRFEHTASGRVNEDAIHRVFKSVRKDLFAQGRIGRVLNKADLKLLLTEGWNALGRSEVGAVAAKWVDINVP